MRGQERRQTSSSTATAIATTTATLSLPSRSTLFYLRTHYPRSQVCLNLATPYKHVYCLDIIGAWIHPKPEPNGPSGVNGSEGPASESAGGVGTSGGVGTGVGEGEGDGLGWVTSCMEPRDDWRHRFLRAGGFEALYGSLNQQVGNGYRNGYRNG